MKSVIALMSPRGSKGRRAARSLNDDAVTRAQAKVNAKQHKKEYVQWLASQLPGFKPEMFKDAAQLTQFKQTLKENGIALTKTSTKVDGVEKFYIVLTEHGKEVSTFKLTEGE